MDITAQTGVKRAGLSLQLPPALRITGAYSGLAASTTDSFGQRTSRTLAWTPGTRTAKVHVNAVAAGPAQIQADISDTDRPDPRRTRHDSVELTIGTSEGSSAKGVSVTKTRPAPVHRPAPGARKERPCHSAECDADHEYHVSRFETPAAESPRKGLRVPTRCGNRHVMARELARGPKVV
ncbi:metallopeptidase [Streptomyces sp. NBRC 110611]|uniref:hypothetical protein n=1 Tax=Streptomyces sp. NBRC 110611 TaxID=1621259 RepID=UPI000857B36E|nr:hypothetical protein [Streptomyces sp. NBRC 110611]GAU66452.1 metallopeptidase [Streptomyces sp. NBRC 110611]